MWGATSLSVSTVKPCAEVSWSTSNVKPGAFTFEVFSLEKETSTLPVNILEVPSSLSETRQLAKEEQSVECVGCTWLGHWWRYRSGKHEWLIDRNSRLWLRNFTVSLWVRAQSFLEFPKRSEIVTQAGNPFRETTHFEAEPHPSSPDIPCQWLTW